MSKLLLSIHVLAGIIFIGPITVAASMFPPVARRALAAPEPAEVPVLKTLHRITSVYAVAGLSVPVFGIATASSMGVLSDTWLIISMVLTAVAAAILALLIVPAQAVVLAAAAGQSVDLAAAAAKSKALSMTTGLFALTWSVVVVLMITRPGSTTGA